MSVDFAPPLQAPEVREPFSHEMLHVVLDRSQEASSAHAKHCEAWHAAYAEHYPGAAVVARALVDIPVLVSAFVVRNAEVQLLGEQLRQRDVTIARLREIIHNGAAR
jgi:hypothetical protein